MPEQKIEESAEQKKEDIKADEAKKEEEIKAETQIEESKEESKTEDPKAEESEEESKEEPKEEKPAEQPTVPAATKVEQPVEDASADDVVVKENITVHIEWEDEDDALGLRPQTRAVTLSGSDGQTYSATLSEKDGWQHTFADLTTQRGAEVIYYSVDADDVTDYDKDVRGLTVTYTCTAKPVAEEEPVIDEQPVTEDENLIDDQMDGEQGELPEGDGPTVTETEDGTVIDMGETAEEPVEGEEANADKIEEDGELDEDFTLPEEGELPAEDAEPEIPEIPEIDFSTLSVDLLFRSFSSALVSSSRRASFFGASGAGSPSALPAPSRVQAGLRRFRRGFRLPSRVPASCAGAESGSFTGSGSCTGAGSGSSHGFRPCTARVPARALPPSEVLPDSAPRPPRRFWKILRLDVLGEAGHAARDAQRRRDHHRHNLFPTVFHLEKPPSVWFVSIF